MNVNIRKIASSDDPLIAAIIRDVMPHFGATGPGFAIHDAEVDKMYEAYQQPGYCYYVCEVEGVVKGGGGIGPLAGGDPSICELKKMYFLPEARGKGFGKELLSACLKEGKVLGYEKCYLETFHTMTIAMGLYESLGFKPIAESLGKTGHFACDRFYLADLSG